MAQIANTKIYLSKEQQAEYDEFAAAADRFFERARRDKNVALQFLRDSGYFEIMAAQAAEQAAANENGKGKIKSAKVKSPTRTAAKSKQVKVK